MRRFLVLAVLALFAKGAMAEETVMRFGRFGKVTIYRNTPYPAHAVLFVSGDGGWNLGVVDMAHDLAAMDAMVVGIDITHYLKQLRTSKEKCSYPASDFEELSQYVQKELGFPTYIPPVLVGYSSGATLVYAILAQAPPTTFKGAISMGFCPDLPLNKPLCRGQGLQQEPLPNGKGYQFPPVQHLEAPWVAFQGVIDQVCDDKAVEAYVKQVPHGDMILLPKVGHGFSVTKNWLPQFQETFKRIVAKDDSTPPSLHQSTKDLPLIEVAAAQPERDFFAVVVSGDGGWAGIDRQIAKTLGKDGVPVVGLNSLKYFWKKRTPEEASKDLERILRHYFSAWGKQSVVLVGYSRGADVLPFMANRLPKELLEKTAIIALLGLEASVDFEIHPGDLLNLGSKNTKPTRPEIDVLKGQKILCFYGEDENDSLCRNLPAELAEAIRMKGGHHFGGDYQKIAEEVLRRVR